ncbi:flavodoxin family protein [Candidatus Bathyarchaeota archaeon]|nr:flavodoxin family protein [Candidatus Bathyarchaeota archaeon]
MKVIAVNGSARGSAGNTAAAIMVVKKMLERSGDINCSVIHLKDKHVNPCNGCLACKEKNECIQDDDMNGIYRMAQDADAIILASPTYFSNVTSRMQMFIERCGILARANGDTLKGKLGASITVARRAGENFVYAALNYFFGIAQMPIVTSSYWNNILAGAPGETKDDEEGIEVLKQLGKNLEAILRKLNK